MAGLLRNALPAAQAYAAETLVAILNMMLELGEGHDIHATFRRGAPRPDHRSLADRYALHAPGSTPVVLRRTPVVC